MRVVATTAVGRLTKRSEFLAVAASGRRFHTGLLTAQGRSRTADEPLVAGLRVGLTLTKRVGHATERNRIRRRLRAAIAVALTERAAEPLDLVLVGRRDALSAGFPRLVDDLHRAVAGLTKSRPARPPAAGASRTQPS